MNKVVGFFVQAGTTSHVNVQLESSKDGIF